MNQKIVDRIEKHVLKAQQLNGENCKMADLMVTLHPSMFIECDRELALVRKIIAEYRNDK